MAHIALRLRCGTRQTDMVFLSTKRQRVIRGVGELGHSLTLRALREWGLLLAWGGLAVHPHLPPNDEQQVQRPDDGGGAEGDGGDR